MHDRLCLPGVRDKIYLQETWDKTGEMAWHVFRGTIRLPSLAAKFWCVGILRCVDKVRMGDFAESPILSPACYRWVEGLRNCRRGSQGWIFTPEFRVTAKIWIHMK